MQKPESVLENETYKILLDFVLNQITQSRPEGHT